MDPLRLQGPARVSSLLVPALLLAACGGGTARVRVSTPRPLGRGGVEKAIFMTVREPGSAAEFRGAVLGGLVKGFLESGRYSALPLEGEASLEGSKALARARGAGLLVYLTDARASLASTEHHIHHYVDGSASGEAAVIDARSGAVLAVAREKASASARARYTSDRQVLDHLADRLARELSRSLLYESKGSLVDLEDPGDGSLRRGIELAKRGDWVGARAAWEETLAAGGHPAAAHYNLAMAARVLGEPGTARIHLEAAQELDRSSTRYRRALEEISREGGK